MVEMMPGEHNGIRLVGIFEIFMTQDNFLWWMASFDGVKLIEYYQGTHSLAYTTEGHGL